MAAFALLAEAAFVDVLAIMAASAGIRRQYLVALHGHLVAIMAIGLFVGAIEFVLGTTIMVEVPGLPVTCVVAAIALLAQTQLMLVLLLVAGITIRLGVLELRRFVALLAVSLDVLAQ